LALVEVSTENYLRRRKKTRVLRCISGRVERSGSVLRSRGETPDSEQGEGLREMEEGLAKKSW